MSDNVLNAEDLAQNKSHALLETAFHWVVVRKVTTETLNKWRHDERCYGEK